MTRTLGAALFLLLEMTTSAAAHKASDAFLNLTVTTATIEGRVDIALRDLEQAVGLDADGDRAITWSELAAQRSALDSYVMSRLELAADGTPCPIQPGALLVDRHSDGAYAVLRIVAACAAPPTRLSIDYRFLFDLDPLHRGLVQVTDDGAPVHTGVLSPEAPRLQVDVHASPDLLGQLVSFGWQGAWHIWLGFDHLLFLFSLLLPAVLRRENGRWCPVGTLREAAGEVVRVVSAFTLAHSITLCLATLGLVSLPSRLVESAIAASVVLAALNNVWPVVRQRLWLLAFGFGLIHGLGFASALLDLGLPAHALAVPLLAFNLGVEFGQLALVALMLPIAFLLRETALYPRLMLRACSGAIAGIGGVWLLERLLDLRLI